MQVGAPASGESDVHKVPFGDKSGRVGSAGNIPDREADLSCTLHGRESRTAVRDRKGRAEPLVGAARDVRAPPAGGHRPRAARGRRPPTNAPSATGGKGRGACDHMRLCIAHRFRHCVLHVHFEVKIWICVSVCIIDEEKKNQKKSQSAP